MNRIILRILVLSFIILGYIAWGMYLMEIDDHYGDLQEIYFDSESGDLIINKQTQKFGIITKDWKRAGVITKEKDTIDLFELIYVDQEENKFEVFRGRHEFKIKELTFDKILELKKNKILESVIKN